MNLLHSSLLIDKFSEEHKNSSFHFTSDSYHCNLYSLKRLYNYNINFTCTFNKNGKSFPEIIRKFNLNKGETKLFCIENTDINFYFQYEKKQIQFASNLYGAQIYKYLNKKYKYKYKPEIICQYNLTKPGVLSHFDFF